MLGRAATLGASAGKVKVRPRPLRGRSRTLVGYGEGGREGGRIYRALSVRRIIVMVLIGFGQIGDDQS